MNESISRHFRLKLLNSGDNKLYRIGGQGGLLDNVILEGGTKGTLDTRYDVGEIALGSGERADVIIVPSGSGGSHHSTGRQSAARSLQAQHGSAG